MLGIASSLWAATCGQYGHPGSYPATKFERVRRADLVKRLDPISFHIARIRRGSLYQSLKVASDQPNLRVSLLAGGAYFGLFYSDGVRFAVERRGREVWGDWPEKLHGRRCLHIFARTGDWIPVASAGGDVPARECRCCGEQAIALAGCPGAGKSTLAAAFARSGFSVIADDMVALRKTERTF